MNKSLAIVGASALGAGLFALKLEGVDALKPVGILPVTAGANEGEVSGGLDSLTTLSVGHEDGGLDIQRKSTPFVEAEHSQQMDRLSKAADELKFHAEASLDGALYVNEVLDHVMTLAELPVREYLDFEYEDNDSMAYVLEGTPESVDAHFLVGREPFNDGDESFRSIGIDIQIDAKESLFSRDSLRWGSGIELDIAYGEDDPETPVKFSMLVHKPVDLNGSWQKGINAYEGQYTSGALYSIDLLAAPNEPTTQTYGIVNGHPTAGPEFLGLSPLVGDIQLDTDKLAALLRQLQQHQKTVRGNR